MSRDVVHLLQDLVRIDSRNSLPLEKPGVRLANERAMCDELAELLGALGFACTTTDAAPDRSNLVATHCAAPGHPYLAFEAHMDTVGTDGMTIPPLVPEIREGRVYGRGACDTKGSMAAMLCAMAALIAEKIPINLMLIASCAEETGCEGAPFIDLTPWELHGIIVGEPTGNKPIVAHKANACFELVCGGEAAHGACPENGINAISRGGRLISYLETNIIPALSRHHHPLFRGSTLSINLISGGTKANIVPDRCTITCDLRLVPGHGSPATVVDDIARRASQALGFPVHTGWVHITPGMDTDPSCSFAKAVEQAIAAAGYDATPGSVSYCTDGGVFGTRGIPSIILGPGDIRQAHGAVEYVEISQLREAVTLYRAIGQHLGTA